MTTGPDAAIDAAPDAPGCVPTLDDDFSGGGAPCGTWASLNKRNATVSLVNGQWTAAFGQADSYAQCISVGTSAVPSGGIFAELEAVSGDAWFGFRKGTTEITMYAGYGAFRLDSAGTNFAFGAYDPVAMRYWRLRIAPAGDTVISDYSADGATWTDFGGASLPFAADSEVELYFGGGVGGGTPPLTLAFERVGSCL